MYKNMYNNICTLTIAVVEELSDQQRVEMKRDEWEPMEEQTEQMQAVFSEAQPVYSMHVPSDQPQSDAQQESSEVDDVSHEVNQRTEDKVNHIEAPPPPVSQKEIPV